MVCPQLNAPHIFGERFVGPIMDKSTGAQTTVGMFQLSLLANDYSRSLINYHKPILGWPHWHINKLFIIEYPLLLFIYHCEPLLAGQ